MVHTSSSLDDHGLSSLQRTKPVKSVPRSERGARKGSRLGRCPTIGRLHNIGLRENRELTSDSLVRSSHSGTTAVKGYGTGLMLGVENRADDITNDELLDGRSDSDDGSSAVRKGDDGVLGRPRVEAGQEHNVAEVGGGGLEADKNLIGAEGGGEGLDGLGEGLGTGGAGGSDPGGGFGGEGGSRHRGNLKEEVKT